MLIEKTDMIHGGFLERLDSNRDFDFASSLQGVIHMATLESRELPSGVTLRIMQIWRDEKYVVVWQGLKAAVIYKLVAFEGLDDEVHPFDWVQLDLIDNPIT